MGVPIEWNFMVVYGAFALFWGERVRGELPVAELRTRQAWAPR